MFSRYKTEAIPLLKREKGEADRRITFFSRQFGRIEVVGRGIRKIDSKLRSGVPPFSLSRIEFIQGRYFKILTFAQRDESFEGLKNNLPRLRIAYKMRDFLLDLVTEPQKDSRTWSFLLRSLRRLGEIEPSQPLLKTLYFTFAWRLLSLLGYGPRLRRCLSCGKKVEADKEVVFKRGGVVCSACARGKREKKVEPGVLDLLRAMKEESFSSLFPLEVKKEELRESARLLSFYQGEI